MTLHMIKLVVGCDTMVEDGGMISYSINYTDLGQRAGEMAVKILTEGADPATILGAVTPVPEGFEAPAPCTGEGAYSARVDEDPAEPELPERSGETLTITVTGIDGDHAELEAAIGGGDPRPIEPATLGETVTIDLWTISITSVCTDTEQVEFDLIN